MKITLQGRILVGLFSDVKGFDILFDLAVIRDTRTISAIADESRDSRG